MSLRAGLPLALFLLTVLVFWPSLTTPFFFDDLGDIVDNDEIRRLWPPSWLFAGPPESNALAGRPISALTFALSYSWGGLEVKGYHVFNIVLHGLSTLLVFGFVRRALSVVDAVSISEKGRRLLAAAVAGIWTVHPLLTEAVAYTVQRTELLVSFFYLLTMYCALRALEGPRRGVWEASAVVAAALGMGSKETMVTAPLAVVLFDWVFLGPGAMRARRRLYLGLALAWIPLALLLASGKQVSVALHEEDLSGLDYLWTQGRVICRYLRLVIWPDPLVIAYDWEKKTPLAQGLPYFVVVAGLAVASVWAAYRRLWIGFLGVWFFLLLAPSSSVLPLPSEIVGERRMYLPLACVVAALIFAARSALMKWRPGLAHTPMPYVVVGALIVALALASRDRLGDYRSTFAIWEDAVRKSPWHSSVRNNFARELIEQRRFGEAIPHLEEAIALRPGLAVPHHLLGIAWFGVGQPAKAIEQLRESIRLDPTKRNVHFRLARSFYSIGDFKAAANAYREVLALTQDDEDAWDELSTTLEKMGDFAGAADALRSAIRLSPANAKLQNRLASLLLRIGDEPGALAALRRGVELEPGYALGHFNLGNALAAHGDPEGALREYLEAVRVSPQDARVRRLVMEKLAQLPPSARRSLEGTGGGPSR